MGETEEEGAYARVSVHECEACCGKKGKRHVLAKI